MRANKIVFENPPEGDFVARFAEERAVLLADGKILTEKLGILEQSIAPVDMNQSFELLDVATGLGSGSFMTYEQLYAALYTMYVNASKEKHVTPEPEPEPTTTDTTNPDTTA